MLADIGCHNPCQQVHPGGSSEHEHPGQQVAVHTQFQRARAHHGNAAMLCSCPARVLPHSSEEATLEGKWF